MIIFHTYDAIRHSVVPRRKKYNPKGFGRGTDRSNIITGMSGLGKSQAGPIRASGLAWMIGCPTRAEMEAGAGPVTPICYALKREYGQIAALGLIAVGAFFLGKK